MVQILPQRPQVIRPAKKKLGEELAEVGRIGLEAFTNQIISNKEKKALKEQEEQENNALKEMGIDPRIKDPAIRKELVKNYGETKSKLDVYKGYKNLKNERKGKNLANEYPEEEIMEQDLEERSPLQIQDSRKNENRRNITNLDEINVTLPKMHSEEDIEEMSFLNPQQSRIMQKQNEEVERQRRHHEEEFQKSRRHEEDLDYQSFKDNGDYVEKIVSGYDAYKRDSGILDNMEGLINQGEMPSPMMVAALDKLGLPLGILENPTAEQFEKLSQELMKNIQGTYGNRILQTEVQNFMKSIPTLLNSEEGKRRLVQQWKILNEGKRVYYNAYEKILEQNPDRLPKNLHYKVSKQAEKELDKISERFRNLADIPADYKKTPGMVLVKDPSGEMGEIEMDAMEAALRDGYEFLE